MTPMATPNMTVGQLVSFRIVCYLVNQQGLNIVNYKVGAVLNQMTFQQAADSASDQFSVVYKPWLALQAEYLGCEMRVTDGTNDYARVQSIVGQGVGAALTQPQPKQVSGLISTFTDYAGR